jgi:hypothetical protein
MFQGYLESVSILFFITKLKIYLLSQVYDGDLHICYILIFFIYFIY